MRRCEFRYWRAPCKGGAFPWGQAPPGNRARQTQQVVRDLEIGQPINSENCSETAEGVARESEGRIRLSLLRAHTTRSTARTSWHTPTPSVARTRAHRG